MPESPVAPAAVVIPSSERRRRAFYCDHADHKKKDGLDCVRVFLTPADPDNFVPSAHSTAG